MYIVEIFDEVSMSWFQATAKGTLYVRNFMTCLNCVRDYHKIGVIARLKKWA